MCHNSASNEQNVRVGMGVDKTESYDGLVGQTYELKSMLHAIHSAGEEGAEPDRHLPEHGIYAWAPSEDLLRNWPGAGQRRFRCSVRIRRRRSCNPQLLHADLSAGVE